MIPFDKMFTLFRHVFCECKECSAIFRLSDAEMSSSELPPKDDWLAELDKKINLLQKKIEDAESVFEKKRQLIVEKERKAVVLETHRQVKTIIPHFHKITLNMRDVKTIGYPVRFISFDGRDDGSTKLIRFIDFEPETKQQEKRLNSIDKILNKGNHEWKTLRIDDNGKISEDK